jgi:L-ribulose-5-phosphate 4-epimerase
MTADESAARHREAIASGRTSLGIEFGSTRIKACLVDLDDPSTVIAVGSHEWENEFVDRVWTYSLDAVWGGLQSAYADLLADLEWRLGVRPATFGAIGVSAMMHGYLPFDASGDLLVPFRTWRNTTTERAAEQLSEKLGVNIPQRWSIAHLHQAVLDAEPHVERLSFLTTLAGYVHWQLTGHKVLGVGDASGMFPIDSATKNYDAELVSRYDALAAEHVSGISLTALLPEVLPAGRTAGRLTAEGAARLDATGTLQPGIPFSPPEGDAGTGMVATNSVAPRTGNVSAGTSIFAMVVLERPLAGRHHELDLVTTPGGDAVAMVHCNNGASELAAWAGLFSRFADASGAAIDTDVVYDTLFREALDGESDAGGVLAFNNLAGEPITGLAEGRPLVVRSPESRLTLGNLFRAQLYGAFGTLALGMRVLADEGVALDRMFAHGGMFRTAGVAQRILAGALEAPVSVAANASEGGAWGAALLAAYLPSAEAGVDLDEYLATRVFGGFDFETEEPHPEDVTGFAAYLETYRAGLAVERSAIEALPLSADATSETGSVASDAVASESPAVRATREQVAALHAELTSNGLVVWTGGNVSGRVPGEDLFVIKPSGVDYDDLSPDNMILCTLDGEVVPGSLGSDRSPSSDTAAHAYVYRNLPEVGGVVHTHSTYATAWAARAEPIPCVITAMADEFGGDIPVGPFAIIGDDSIGRGIVATLTGHRSRAVLMQNHGVFTIGRDARDAVKAAVMTEDVARTVHIARQAGPLVPIPKEAIDRLFDRYQNVYGQSPEGDIA